MKDEEIMRHISTKKGRSFKEDAFCPSSNWLGAGKVVEILKATRDRGIWKDMIANAIKHGTG